MTCSARRGARRSRRSVLALAAAAVGSLVLGVVSPAPATAGPDVRLAALLPVVHVHGGLGQPSIFNTMRSSLEADGYRTYAIDLPGTDNYANARAIQTYVDQVSAENGGSKVHIVAHSMGGISSRYYIKYYGGTAKVARYVSMGSPQQGYRAGCSWGTVAGDQMCPGSPFMTELNAGDDTPGPTVYATFWSSIDEEAPGIAQLDGGACHKEIAGVPHALEPSNGQFISAVKTWLAGTCP